MTRFISDWQIAILSLLVMLLISVNFNLFPIGETQKSQVIIAMTIEESDKYEPGQTFFVDFYSSGKDGEAVTAADIRPNFDKDTLKLISANPGNFYVNPVVVRWDLEDGVFALANPGKKINKGAPLVKLEFEVLRESSSPSISLDPKTQVYVYQKGGVYPNLSTEYYKLNVQ